MIDVTADIVIPGSTRSAWKPSDGQWMLRRALRSTERAVVEARANDLAHALTPLSDPEKPTAFALIATMLNGWRQMRSVDGEDAELTVKIIIAGLANAPLWAIDVACQRFRTGRVDNVVPEFNSNYPPNDIQIIKVVEHIVNICKRRERDARDLLSAPVEPPPPPPPPKIERPNLIKYADIQNGVVPSAPLRGSYMARVLADIAARKGRVECTEPPTTSPTTTGPAGVGQTATGHQVVYEPDGSAGTAHTGNP